MTATRVTTVLGVLAAVAVVAVASRGSTPATTDRVRQPSDTLLDLVFSLYVVGIALGGVLFVALLVLRRFATLAERPPGRGNPLRTFLVAVVLITALFAVLRWLQVTDPAITPREVPAVPPADAAPTPTRDTAEQYEAEFAWRPLLALGLVALLGVLAWWRAGRARRLARERTPRQTLAETLADVLEETLDALRAEPDPRRAVIGAYARLERVAAASGLARRPAEAPLEYLGRMLAGLEVGEAAVRRLTVLFERAKFSHHAMDAAMKDEAIGALESVQEDLHQAELRARRARAEAAALARERAQERARA